MYTCIRSPSLSLLHSTTISVFCLSSLSSVHTCLIISTCHIAGYLTAKASSTHQASLACYTCFCWCTWIDCCLTWPRAVGNVLMHTHTHTLLHTHTHTCLDMGLCPAISFGCESRRRLCVELSRLLRREANGQKVISINIEEGECKCLPKNILYAYR